MDKATERCAPCASNQVTQLKDQIVHEMPTRVILRGGILRCLATARRFRQFASRSIFRFIVGFAIKALYRVFALSRASRLASDRVFALSRLSRSKLSMAFSRWSAAVSRAIAARNFDLQLAAAASQNSQATGLPGRTVRKESDLFAVTPPASSMSQHFNRARPPSASPRSEKLRRPPRR